MNKMDPEEFRIALDQMKEILLAHQAQHINPGEIPLFTFYHWPIGIFFDQQAPEAEKQKRRLRRQELRNKEAI